MKIISLLTVLLLCSCATTTAKIPAVDGTPKIQTGYAPVNDLKMYYEVHGEAKPGTPPLLLLHGGGSTIETSFAKVIPVFTKHRQVIAFEQQGNGRTSDVKDRPFSFEQSAKDAVALLKYLKIEKADLFGYSNGGHIAIQIALDHPAVVNKIVLESAMTSREGTPPGFWKGFKNAKITDMPAELKAAFLKVNPNQEALQAMFEKSRARMEHFKGWPEKTIKGIKMPVLIVMGDRDAVTPEHGAWLLKTLPKAELMILPATDHMNIVERATWLEPAVENFLKR